MHAPITASIQKDPLGEGSIWRGHFPPVGASRQFLIDLPGDTCRTDFANKLQKFLGVPVNLQEMEALHPHSERWQPMVMATIDWDVTEKIRKLTDGTVPLWIGDQQVAIFPMGPVRPMGFPSPKKSLREQALHQGYMDNEDWGDGTSTYTLTVNTSPPTLGEKSAAKTTPEPCGSTSTPRPPARLNTAVTYTCTQS